MSTGCTSKKDAVSTPGIRVENMDTLTAPGVSFYQYACGGWMKNNPLTDEYSRFGSFDMLAENNQVQLHELIEELAAKQHQEGTVAQKVGTLYAIAMNQEKLNEDGAKPIRQQLIDLGNIRSKKEMGGVLALLHRKGITPYFVPYVGADDMNSSMNIVHTYQAGIGMGERDYYLENDDNSVNIRNKYQVHVGNMFRLAGFDNTYSQNAVKAVMKIENSLAKAARSREDLRDPYLNYNKFTIEELKSKFAPFDWDTYFTTYGLGGLTELSIGQPGGISEMVRIIDTYPLDEQIAYLQWYVMSNAASYLSDDFVNEDFDFFGKTMSGKQELRPRWKRAVNAVDNALGEAVGQMYVEKHFPPAAKERMLTLVKNLQTALGERIQNLEWMSAETKEKAMGKLGTFHVKIGYPDKWRDYTALEIKDDSYWANIERATIFETDIMIAKAGKPVDKDEWLMTPQTVNAYYNPTTNEICFPAGILQYPFFDMEADDAFNYGAIGVVIGHEMTHGFDDQGRQYDKDGNLKDWWTADDARNFEERSNVMAEYFNRIEVAPGVFANGRFTLGENIADYGGLQVSYQAFKNAVAGNPLGEKEGLTPEQRFFLAYANVWAGNIRPEEVLRRTKNDPHSLGRWRVDGALPHIQAWYEAYNITENDPMYLPVEERAAIW